MTTTEYELSELLHTGSTAVVLRGRRITDGKGIVSKQSCDVSTLPQDYVRFRHEYEVLRELEEKGVTGIPRACALHRGTQTVGLVLEDVGAISLQKFIEDGGSDLRTALRIGIEVARTLSQIHQAGWIHRDVNPNNIVYNPTTAVTQLIDFGAAAPVKQAAGGLAEATAVRGTLAYFAPEQTGRLSRPVDSRADLYSLGTTLYQLLTGRLPFECEDALELVHAHLAKVPKAPHELSPAVPITVSKVVSKLLSKAPEDRYQNAASLEGDLSKCLVQLEETNSVDAFPLAVGDVWGHFEPPQKVIGREQERAVLLAAFERAAKGHVEHLLIAGQAGIGKTSLARELYEPVTADRGYFASGKFEQFRRGVPLSALASAFDDLVRQLLSEGEERVAEWRTRVINAIGDAASIITKVVPSLELLLGPQPPAPELSGVESQNRFNLTFVDFAQIFCKPEHPLVLFLDDVQWADPASLGLLSMILTAPGTTGCLLISAYRESEMSPTHPFMLTVTQHEQQRISVSRTSLGPLDVEHTTALVAATLHASLSECAPLGRLIWAKTAGNPFFVRQLLSLLHDRGLIAFDPRLGRFGYQLDLIERAELSDNVVDLLVGKMTTMPRATREVLQLAGAVGNQFELRTLCVLTETTPQQVRAALLVGIAAGLVVPTSALGALDNTLHEDTGHTRYRFVHDRVHHAAYSMIADADRPLLHLRIGRALLDSTELDHIPATVFDLVTHLNQGIELLTDDRERQHLADLNALAGNEAKSTTAYAFAIEALRLAIELMGPECWEHDHVRAYRAHASLADALCLGASFEQSLQVIASALEHCSLKLERTRLLILKLNVYVSMGRMVEAVDSVFDAAGPLGLDLPRDPERTREVLQGEIGKILKKTTEVEIERFIELPEMKDVEQVVLMELLMRGIPPLYQVNPELFAFVCCRMVTLSFEHGNCPVSAKGYGSFAVISSGILGNFRDAERFGKLGVDLNLRFDDLSVRSSAYFVWAAFASPWNRPIRESIRLFHEGMKYGLQGGDHPHVAYNAARCITHELFMGVPLPELSGDAQRHFDLVVRIDDATNQRLLRPCIQAIRWFQGELEGATLNGPGFDEDSYLEEITQSGNQSILSYFATLRLLQRYWAGAYHEALDFAAQSESLLQFSVGFICVAEHNIYYSLTLTALWQTASETERVTYVDVLDRNQEQLAKWVESCPENFEHYYLLIAAERARLDADKLRAMDLYDRAISAAAANGFAHVEALAAELAAGFWDSEGRRAFADLYLKQAAAGYEIWGALGRSQALVPHAVAQSQTIGTHASRTLHSITEDRTTFDVASVFKAGAAISGELLFESLLEKLMTIIVENAGAELGALALEHEGALVIQASQIQGGAPVVLQQMALEESDFLCSSIVSYVAHTRELLVLEDASAQGRFRNDPYVAQKGLKSILCAPIIHQARLLGVLYLENNLMVGAFTMERIETLRVLVAQTAVSIQNSQLFAKQEKQRQQIERQNQRLIKEVAEREQAERELSTYRDHLEELVAARTSELKRAHGRLMGLSRQAGMAEVATGVLHNVGNVLNSVNVGATMARDAAKTMRVSALVKVAHVLSKQPDDLAAYLTGDEKGRRMPEYVRTLSATLLREQESIVDSINTTVEHLDHMKKIISAQQEYGKSVNLEEQCALDVVVETALDISAAASSDLGIEIVRDYRYGEPIAIDRNQVLQILVNVLSNARHAIEEHKPQRPVIDLGICRVGDSQVAISIRDNGVGIERGALQRVFNHGFTTKRNGHGFGLHNSANAAQRLNGQLEAHSEGRGQGALFVLTLPLRDAGEHLSTPCQAETLEELRAEARDDIDCMEKR